MLIFGHKATGVWHTNLYILITFTFRKHEWTLLHFFSKARTLCNSVSGIHIYTFWRLNTLSSYQVQTCSWTCQVQSCQLYFIDCLLHSCIRTAIGHHRRADGLHIINGFLHSLGRWSSEIQVSVTWVFPGVFFFGLLLASFLLGCLLSLRAWWLHACPNLYW